MESKSFSLQKRKTMEAYLFVLPAFIYIVVVMGYPLVYNIILSLQNVTVRNLDRKSVV